MYLRDPERAVAHHEVFLAASREPELAPAAEEWTATNTAMLEPLLERLGSPSPGGDARIVNAVLNGLTLEQLGSPTEDFTEQVAHPALRRTLDALLSHDSQEGTMTTLTIDDAILSTLEEGYTLPASWYTDRAIAELERERIFSRSWQYAGPAELVAEPGSFLATRVAHAPVVSSATRTARCEASSTSAATARILSPAATASARRCSVRTTPGRTAWTAACAAPPAPTGSRRSTASQFSLIPVKVERLGPMLFANLDTGSGRWTGVLGDVPARLRRGRRRPRPTGAPPPLGLEHPSANWKTGLENYLECYHCPVAHPGLSKVVDVSADAYRLVEHGMVASQFGNPRDPDAFSDTTVTHAQYHLLFPGDHVQRRARADEPVGRRQPARVRPAARRRASHDFYAPAEVGDEELGELMAFADQVGKEDEALVEGVREGLESGLVPQGRLITSSEHQIAWFQRLVFEALSSRG